MGQKVHPFGFRLGITQKHRSYWFAKNENYPELVFEDTLIRQYFYKNFSGAGITNIEIQRKLDQIKIEISLARPGILLGREGKGLENLRQTLQQKLKVSRLNQTFITSSSYKKRQQKTFSPQITLQVIEVSTPDSQAAFIAEFLVEQLQKRVAFRRAIKQAVQRAQRARVKGIKIQVSGRLNGAEIARTEWVRQGRVPLHTLRAQIDYASNSAKTIFGLLGIKIWIFQGEKLTPLKNY